MLIVSKSAITSETKDSDWKLKIRSSDCRWLVKRHRIEKSLFNAEMKKKQHSLLDFIQHDFDRHRLLLLLTRNWNWIINRKFSSSESFVRDPRCAFCCADHDHSTWMSKISARWRSCDCRKKNTVAKQPVMSMIVKKQENLKFHDKVRRDSLSAPLTDNILHK